MCNKTVSWIALILVIIGGLNWGLIGAFKFDLVAYLFAGISVLQNIIYIVVGIAAIYMIYFAAKKMK